MEKRRLRSESQNKFELEDRTKIFDKVCRLVENKHFDPGMNEVNWKLLAQRRGGARRKLTDEIGPLVAMSPGVIGIDVSKDVDRGIAALDGCSRLIIDLRGNTRGESADCG